MTTLATARRATAVLAMTVTVVAATTVVPAVADEAAVAAPASVRPVPRPPIYPASTTYTLAANGVAVPISAYGQYDYAQFSMGAGTADLVVAKLNNTDVGAAYISPIKLGYVATRSGNTASFTIRGPEYLIVKLDGRRPLVIAADPAETDTPANKGPDIFNITEGRFGADPTGGRTSTAAIQAALDAASAYGSRPTYPRGIVYVPRGVYSVANLDIRSNTSLYLEPGAVLRAVAQKNLYTIDARKDSQQRDLSWWIQTAFGATNIKIFGRGTLDGNGPAMLGTGLGLNILAPIASSRITVDGVTVREASSWSVIPVRSNDVRLTNMKLLNRFDMGENDGIDVVESQDVVVRRGIGIGLDDPYTTKSYPQMAGDIGRNWPGQPEKVRDVLFDGLLSWTYCYGFKVGQGVFNDHEDVTFSNSVVYDAAVGIGIHHKAYRAAARRITFSNIDIERISFSNDGNRTWLAFMIADSANDGGGPITDVTVTQVTVRNRGTTAAKLTGLSDSAAISGVRLDSIRMPGSTGYATTLEQMNITDRRFVSGITITP